MRMVAQIALLSFPMDGKVVSWSEKSEEKLQKIADSLKQYSSDFLGKNQHRMSAHHPNFDPILKPGD